MTAYDVLTSYGFVDEPGDKIASMLGLEPVENEHAARVTGEYLESEVATVGDFATDIQGDPQGFGASWNKIQSQLTAEAASATDVTAAKSDFASAWEYLTQKGLTGTEALGPATQYIMTGQTLIGAASQVAGLVQAVEQGMPPVGLLETFTGTLIGSLVAANTIAPGVGAAIVGVVDVVLNVLQSIGLFGSPPSGQQICPGLTVTAPPSYMLDGVPNPANYNQVNCIGVYDKDLDAGGIAPGSANWRHFPVVLGSSASPSALAAQAADLGWFLRVNPPQFWEWSWTPAISGAQAIKYVTDPFSVGSSPTKPLGPNKPLRPIDAAFPIYHQLECEAAAGPAFILAQGVAVTDIQAVLAFNAGFAAALKLNWEYSLNGLKVPAQYWQVLAHHVRLWNRTHEPGHGFDIHPSKAIPWTYDGTDCKGIPPWYAAICAHGAVNGNVQDILSNGNTTVHVNTGPAKQALVAAQKPVAASSTSAGTAVVVGTGVLGVILAVAWWAMGKPNLGDLLRELRRGSR